MSGIGGILRFDGHPAETDRLEAMLAAMARRGPDGTGRWSGGSVALGHLMLHTTAESLSERQPLVSADGNRVLVVHGRVDNRGELSDALAHRGTVPVDRSDAALFLAAYETWGDDFPCRIEGDFALVLWDAARRAAICARDRVGVKPFVYHWDGRRFAFASEVRPILELPWVEQELDEETVAQFLMSSLRSFEGTFWRGVRRLAPGHLMIVSADGPRVTRYWRLDFGRRLRYRREEEYVEHYRSLLTDVVRRMSRSHRPLAFEVSGGLDSSALFAVADGLDRDGRLLAPGMAGYTLRFDDETRANELGYARAVATHLGRPLREIDPTRVPLKWYVAEARRLRDFPGYPNGVMHRGLAAAAAADSRVLVQGIGGDELHSGSVERYADSLVHGEFAALPGMLRKDLRDLGISDTARAVMRGMAWPLLPAPFRSIARHLLLRRPVSKSGDWLSPRLAEEFRAVPSEAGVAIATGFEDRQRLLLWLVNPTLSHHLELGERETAGSLEVRSPYLDAGLVAFAASLPERLLASGSIDKRLHRAAMRGLLPQMVTERPDKAEFSSVFWQPLAELHDRLAELPDDSLEGWVDPAKVKEVLGTVLREADFTPALWRAWSLGACLSVTGTLGFGDDESFQRADCKALEQWKRNHTPARL
jgi:asparagine synthase (glutamine-hydrolysing)